MKLVAAVTKANVSSSFGLFVKCRAVIQTLPAAKKSAKGRGTALSAIKIQKQQVMAAGKPKLDINSMKV
jgi:hypothetical protein